MIAFFSDIPKLSEVTEEDLERFVSRSVPIATKAEQLHKVSYFRLILQTCIVMVSTICIVMVSTIDDFLGKADAIF